MEERLMYPEKKQEVNIAAELNNLFTSAAQISYKVNTRVFCESAKGPVV